ncbi:thioredoxin family protein [Rhodococcus spelaei]|uniref:Thioredoxin family protein n=1 Tax=Rhodococcus spelaei TaxID=2546320 RepID=A0A541BAF5_9NOCA|nr:thioredoxin family protein [Rhodococcus spelaei]TQF69208.1 thioredoxin family protein [Rhodococcus spelaei]
MEVEVVYFDGCPNWHTARDRLNEALAAMGRADIAVRLRQVETVDDAEATAFTGSPTVLIDGVDPFAEPGAVVGLSCRLYRTPDGADGSPTVAQLVAALRQAGAIPN